MYELINNILRVTYIYYIMYEEVHVSNTFSYTQLLSLTR